MDVGNETELLNQCKAGSAEAFEILLQPHLPSLFAYSRAICGDFHLAQDVVQETALIAFRNINHLFPEADFATWLRAIARRQALSARRKLNKLILQPQEVIEAVYQDPTPAAGSARQEALVECLSLLGSRMGQVVRGHYFEGLKLAEVAAALEISANAAKQLLYRARLSLQDCMRKRFRLEDVR